MRAGLKKLRSPEFGRLTSGKRTVSRPYGGVLSHEEVKGRYDYSICFAHHRHFAHANIVLLQNCESILDRRSKADEEITLAKR